MRTFFWTLLSTCIGIVALNAALVYCLDPLDRFGRNRTGIHGWFERQHAVQQLRSKPHDAVLFSNSKLFMVPPDRIEGFTWINAAFGAASIEEIAGFIDAYIRHQSVCVIAIDLWDFRQGKVSNPGVPVAPPTPIRPAEYLLSHEWLRRGVLNLAHHLQKRPPLLERGGYVNAAAFQDRVDRLAANPLAQQAGKLLYEWLADHFELDEERLALLAEIRQILDQRGVRTVVILHPQHPTLLRLKEADRLRAASEAFRTALEKVFPDFVDLTTAVTDPADFLENDLLHYTPEVAVRLLNKKVVPTLVQPAHHPPAP